MEELASALFFSHNIHKNNHKNKLNTAINNELLHADKV